MSKACSSSAAASSREAQVPVSRIEALDWTKGTLIFFMVAYHAICLAFRGVAFQYLAFLPPSFILITGFLVGQVYSTKYDLQTWKPYARLGLRGVKLLAIFASLNLAYCILQERSLVDGVWAFVDRSVPIFLSGNERVAIFEVLLPIAYFLLLAPELLWLRGRSPGMIAIAAVAVFALCCGLELWGIRNKNLDLLSVGLVGMAVGLVPMATIHRLASKWVAVAVGYGFYRLCAVVLGETYPVQVLAAATSLLVLYACGIRVGGGSWLSQQMVTLGRYSLLGYLAQIALLQAIARGIGRPQHWGGVVLVGAVTALLTCLTIHLVHDLRRRSASIDAAYKAVFG